MTSPEPEQTAPEQTVPDKPVPEKPVPELRNAETWAIVARFFSGIEDRWLDDFIEDENLRFVKVPPTERDRSWHHGGGRQTSLSQWLGLFGQVWRALRLKPAGMVTCFPQLALVAALLRKMGLGRYRIVAYNFNIGALPGGIRQRIARFAASTIDVFVVHSPQEIAAYATYLGLPMEKFVFIPLQGGAHDIERQEDTDTPFLLSMGSAHRDYPVLLSALDGLSIPTVIVTREDIAATLPVDPDVTCMSGLTERACLELLSRARLSVTPIANLETASGQVTFVNAMQCGVPVIATRCPGTDGYIEHMRTGVLVNPSDSADLRQRIEELWQDPALRASLSAAGLAEAEHRFSDGAAAKRLHSLLTGNRPTEM